LCSTWNASSYTSSSASLPTSTSWLLQTITRQVSAVGRYLLQAPLRKDNALWEDPAEPRVFLESRYLAHMMVLL
jgi:hypothetical protein